jgi:hypothetical protein
MEWELTMLNDRFSIIIFLAVIGVFMGQSGGETMAFELKSSAFAHGQGIPQQYTCDGSDLSVPLNWSDPPEGTVSFTLISDDPDAPVGTWVHWVLYDHPGLSREIPEGVSTQEVLPDGSKQGMNDFRRIGYGGPCPPRGPAHRYFFKLYAVDRLLNFPPGATKAKVLEGIKGHTLGEAQLMGTYQR